MPRLNFDYTFRATNIIVGSATGVKTSGCQSSPIFCYSETPQNAQQGVLINTPMSSPGYVPFLPSAQLGGGITYEPLFGQYKNVYRLDVPRCLTISATPGEALTLTVYGFDEWDRLMEENIISDPVNLVEGNKAFYRILKVWNNTAPTAPTNIQIGISNKLGMPYVINNLADVVKITYSEDPQATPEIFGETPLVNGLSGMISVGSSWPNPMLPFIVLTPLYQAGQGAGAVGIYSVEYQDNPAAFQIHSNNANDSSTIRYLIPGVAPDELEQLSTIIVASSTVPATATSGDIRGLLSCPVAINDIPTFDGTKRVMVCYYLRVATGDKQTVNGSLADPSAPLIEKQGYIGTQFYEGAHA